MNLAGNRTIKRFRVAREGQTVDGRNLSRQYIIDMAETYDPVEYTARINCEHWFSMFPNGEMTSFGDVVAVDYTLEKFTVNGSEVELACLYATLSALPQLVELNKQGKKIFSSIEYYPKFADTGRAYLVGLALTDTPASRGVEPIKFHSSRPDSHFSEPTELVLMSTQTSTDTPATADPTQSTTPTQTASDGGFLAKMSTLFGAKKGMTDDEQNAILQGFAQIQTEQTTFAQKLTAKDDELTALKTQVDELVKTVATLTATLNELSTTSAPTTQVPVATGGSQSLADF